jgi:hypothetical protein
MWVRSLGIAGEERVERAQPLEGDEIRGFLTTSNGGYGPISHLRPGVRLSATPARWKRPVVKLGTHPAEWPASAARIAAQ